MTTATIGMVLQALTSLLLSLQNNPQASQAVLQQTVAITNQVIQINAQQQAMPKINFPIPHNDTIWPNINGLRNAAYIDAEGNYTPDKVGVALVEEDTSFGDINADGFDDTAVIVQSTDNSGNTTFKLAAMLNQGGIMFNIADAPLGKQVEVFSHHVVQGGDIVINMKIDGGAAATSTYYLLGNQLLKK